MATSTIAQLRTNVGTWTNSQGTTYFKNNVALANGVQGTSLSQSETPPYGVGDEVEYEERRNQHGTTLKIRKAGGNFGQGGGNRYNGGANKHASIMRQNAMRTAAMMLGEGRSLHEYQTRAAELIAYFEGTPSQVQAAPQFVETRTESQPFL